MLRRNARLRKEYLLKKSQEGEQKELAQKRQRVKEAIESGKPLPPELREEAERLKEEAEFDDPSNALSTHVDDEYAKVGLYEPKILITSAREASTRLLQFVKELRLCIPNAHRINRGNTDVDELVEMCRNNDYTDLIVVHEHRGEPDGLLISHFPYGPTAYFTLSGCVLRHDIEQDMGTVSEAVPHLIFHNFSSKLGERMTSILQALFPIPKPDTRRVMSFINHDDTIAFRHHVYKKNAPHQRDERGNKLSEVELAEVGPRFELKPYKITLGTLDMSSPEVEWVLKTHYKRNAKASHL
jgi:U3 small nucleolar ribonucleoprotein protein IMP4